MLMTTTPATTWPPEIVQQTGHALPVNSDSPDGDSSGPADDVAAPFNEAVGASHDTAAS